MEEIIKNGYLVDEKGYPIHRKKYFENNPHDKPKKGWVVHHCNCKKLDNRPENLIHLPADLHDWIHKKYGFSEKTLPHRNVIESAKAAPGKKWTKEKTERVKDIIFKQMEGKSRPLEKFNKAKKKQAKNRKKPKNIIPNYKKKLKKERELREIIANVKIKPKNEQIELLKNINLGL